MSIIRNIWDWLRGRPSAAELADLEEQEAFAHRLVEAMDAKGTAYVAGNAWINGDAYVAGDAWPKI